MRLRPALAARTRSSAPGSCDSGASITRLATAVRATRDHRRISLRGELTTRVSRDTRREAVAATHARSATIGFAHGRGARSSGRVA